MLTHTQVRNLNDKDLNEVWIEFLKAQGKHTAEMCAEPHISDDGLDYIGGACDLMSYLTSMVTDGATQDMLAFLFAPNDSDVYPAVNTVACDGVCPELAIYMNY